MLKCTHISGRLRCSPCLLWPSISNYYSNLRHIFTTSRRRCKHMLHCKLDSIGRVRRPTTVVVDRLNGLNHLGFVRFVLKVKLLPYFMAERQQSDSSLCGSLANIEFLDQFLDKVELFCKVWRPDTVGRVQDKHKIGRGVAVRHWKLIKNW